MEASCCVERKIFLSPASASSSARTLASRPTMNGVICCGKMTISRTGIMGTRFNSCFSRLNMGPLNFTKRGQEQPRPQNKTGNSLSSLFEQTPINLAGADHIRGDHEIAYLPLHGEVIHQFQHEVFEDHTQAASADLA